MVVIVVVAAAVATAVAAAEAMIAVASVAGAQLVSVHRTYQCTGTRH